MPEMSQITDDDIQKGISLFQDISKNVKEVSSQVEKLTEKVNNGEISTSKGVSFLEMKYQLLLSYMTNLTYLIHKKSNGRSIVGEESINRLIEIRTVLEKMRPIDQKLKYQIDKLIKTSNTGVSENDPLRLKPQPDNLISKLDEEESESGESGDEEKASGSKAYRPPKLVAMHYDEEQTEKDRKEQAMAKAKKRALSSATIQELREEYSEGPEEIRENADMHRMKVDKKEKDRTRYEEDYFVRMSLSKKERHEARQIRTEGGMGSLANLGDIRGLGDEGGLPDEQQSKKRKKSFKGKGKKGSKKKRFT